MVSATTFTLVGVVNKFLTVLLNVVIWDKHSSFYGIFSVVICLLAGVFYEQAPRVDRSKGDVSQKVDPDPLHQLEMEPLMNDKADLK
jgi:hypothetical protein